MAEHDQPGRGLRHLAHQVRGDEYGAAFGGQRLEQQPDPPHPVRVQPVDRLVEHHRLRLAQQRRGHPQPLPHAEREPPGPRGRDLAQPGQLDHLIDPAAADPRRPRQRQQVVAGRQARVHRPGIQQDPQLRHRRGRPGVVLAVDPHRPAVRPVQPGADLGLGRHGELAGELEARCREHPLRERLWELLILALYRSGRQAEALRAYTEVRDRLAGELASTPARPCGNSRPASWPRTRRSPPPARLRLRWPPRRRQLLAWTIRLVPAHCSRRSCTSRGRGLVWYRVRAWPNGWTAGPR